MSAPSADAGGAFWLLPVAISALFNFYRGVLPLLLGNVPHINDINFHQVLATRIYESGSLDAWVPQWGCGAAVLRYYQNLPHLMAALLAVVLPITPATAIVLLNAVFFGAFPFCLFWAMRRIGFRARAASFAACLTLLIESNRQQKHLFGLMTRCFTWDGWGLYTLIAGAMWSALALGHAYDWIVRGDRVAFCFAAVTLACAWLSHLTAGYGTSLVLIAYAIVPHSHSHSHSQSHSQSHSHSPLQQSTWRGGMARYAALQAAVAAFVAYLIVPAVLEAHVLNRTPFEPAEHWDSYGLWRVLRWLVKGYLFDSAPDRALGVSWFSMLVGGALLAMAARAARQWRNTVAETISATQSPPLSSLSSDVAPIAPISGTSSKGTAPISSKKTAPISGTSSSTTTTSSSSSSSSSLLSSLDDAQPHVAVMGGAFAVALIIFSGRHTLGTFAHLLPLSRNLPFHRFFLLVHMTGVMLAGWFADELYGVAHTALRRAMGARWATFVLLFCLALAVVPEAHRLAGVTREHAGHLRAQRDELADWWGQGVSRAANSHSQSQSQSHSRLQSQSQSQSQSQIAIAIAIANRNRKS